MKKLIIGAIVLQLILLAISINDHGWFWGAITGLVPLYCAGATLGVQKLYFKWQWKQFVKSNEPEREAFMLKLDNMRRGEYEKDTFI